MLTSPDQSQLKQYLIMERIFPPDIKAYMLRKGQLSVGLTNSEIGIYSSVFVDITKDDHIITNHTYGRLLRTKGNQNDEGGINTGFSVID
jgi:Eukaryotic glutathione synthase, ATP binding domain